MTSPEKMEQAGSFGQELQSQPKLVMERHTAPSTKKPHRNARGPLVLMESCKGTTQKCDIGTRNGTS